MNVWPVELPQAPRKRGFAQQDQDMYTRMPMDSGPPKVRLDVSVPLSDVSMVLWMTFEQLDYLDIFYDDHGGEPFEWLNFGQDPPSLAIYNFAGAPRKSKINKTTWAVHLAFNMERL